MWGQPGCPDDMCWDAPTKDAGSHQAAYIFGQDPKLNLYFFPAAHTRNEVNPKNMFVCSLLTWNSLKSLLTHTMFQEVEVWRGGEQPQAGFLVALESLENHSCGKKTPPLHQWMNSRIYVTFYSSKTQCVCVPPHPPRKSP